MATQPWYLARNAFKRASEIPDNVDDEYIDRALRDASRDIEKRAGRHFYPVVDTRYLTAQYSTHILLPWDLLSVTTLKADDGSRTYATTWTASDYDLEPSGALQRNEPYWKIVIPPTGDYPFVVDRPRSIQIAGVFGYYDIRRTLTTLAVAITTTTQATLTAPKGFLDVGQTLRIDSEDIFVSDLTPGVPNDTATIERAINGTTAATHLINATIQVYEYPLIETVCQQLAARMLAERHAHDGILGSTEGVGQLRFRPVDWAILDRLSLKGVGSGT